MTIAIWFTLFLNFTNKYILKYWFFNNEIECSWTR